MLRQCIKTPSLVLPGSKFDYSNSILGGCYLYLKEM